jgi:hypothetical protein
VLTGDVRFEGWTTEDWVRFFNLWKPRAAPDQEPTRPRGGVFVLYDGSRIQKLLHTKKGRLAAAGNWPIPLPDLAATHHASWALAAHLGALEEVMERFGARARRGDDLCMQSLQLLAIVREMIAEGAIQHWPHRLRGVPPPTEAMVRRAVDALCADGKALALGMFKDGELWTAFVARRKGAGFDVIAGPDELRPMMGLLSGDWRRDYRHLARAVEDTYAPLSFGCFAEVRTFRDLQMDARPGAWSRAVAVRDLVVSPVPTAIGLALGVDAARYGFEAVRGVTSRLDPFGFLDPVLRGVRARVGAATGRDVSGVLGFDPMAALRALLKR